MEELEGLEGETYKINNRSNKAYKILDEDIHLLNGIFEESKTIEIRYKSTLRPTDVEIIPNVTNLLVGETKKLDYQFDITGNFDETVEFILTNNDNVAEIKVNQITGLEIGMAPIKIIAKGDGFELENYGSVAVSGTE